MRHELYLTRVGLAALVPVAGACIAIGALVSGGRGAMSAAVAAGLVAANQLVAALSTGWSRVLTPGVLAVGYTVFVGRMLGLLMAFALVASLPWVHAGLFAGAFCAALVACLSAECVSYARGSYVPAWMRRAALVSDGRPT